MEEKCHPVHLHPFAQARVPSASDLRSPREVGCALALRGPAAAGTQEAEPSLLRGGDLLETWFCGARDRVGAGTGIHFCRRW